MSVLSINLFTVALGSFLSLAFNPLCKHPLFTWVYAIAAGMAFIVGVLFWSLFRGQNRQEDRLNYLINEVGRGRITSKKETSQEKV